jgi:hypothetical protein
MIDEAVERVLPQPATLNATFAYAKRRSQKKSKTIGESRLYAYYAIVSSIIDQIVG